MPRKSERRFPKRGHTPTKKQYHAGTILVEGLQRITAFRAINGDGIIA
jgi:hypothetical protein